MPKRQSTNKFLSDEVQGVGSYVVLTKLTVQEVRDLQAQSKKIFREQRELRHKQKMLSSSDNNEQKESELDNRIDEVENENITINFDTISNHFVEWNWVDDDGKPLPSLKEFPETINRLTTDESEFLGECILGQKHAKNLESSS